ncbi:DUF4259 domain-containing protein [Streptomyces sp. NPDC057697]|uniref:DUF4259 domain-containing protein n=1 Tax=Streptomyces sp. NPDC057697 TaxID=3346219 RepID=UPI003696C549
MGGWDTDPFDNDLTDEFEGALDASPEEEQEAMVRTACEAAVAAEGRDEESARLTVASAAWLTRAFPADEEDEPAAAGEPFADLPGLRALAVSALDAIAAAPPALVGEWADGTEEEWRATLGGIREELLP